jgi:hypothetical protein
MKPNIFLLYLAIAAAFLVELSVFAVDSPTQASGCVMPSANAPDFVKSQWEDIAKRIRFPKRSGNAVGLPPGLEEQVWNAWAPGAKRIWRNVAPGYTNVIYDTKVDNGVVTFLLDGFGLVQSKDSGKTWTSLSHHLTTPHYTAIGYYSFDISPANPNIIAVAGAVIDRSLDGGRSWSPVMDKVMPPFKFMPPVAGRSCRSGVMAFGFVRFNADGSRFFAVPGAFGHTYVQRSGVENEMASWLKHKFIYVGDGQVSNFKAIDLGPFAGIRFILPHFADPNLIYASFSDGSIYVCRNAKAETPVFVKLAKPKSLENTQAIWMDVSPNDPSTLLLTMSDTIDKMEWSKPKGKSISKIVLAKVSGDTLVCKDINVGPPPFACARWNPRNPEQVFVGIKWGHKDILISNDGMKTFRKQTFPNKLFPSVHTTGYGCPRTFALDRKSPLSIVYSVTGVWSSLNGFKNVKEMVMRDYGKGLYGNNGVGFAECGMSVCIRKNHVYLATNDHGAWRSNGSDTPKWRKISDNPGALSANNHRLAWPIAVSEDETYVYLVSQQTAWSTKKHKLLLSHDNGDTWRDVTERLGLGPIIEDGIQQIFFDPLNSKTQWVIAANRLFLSTDGGKTFKDTAAKLKRYHYDSKSRRLYAVQGSCVVMKSQDLGFTWQKLPESFNGTVIVVSTLSNGDLVVADSGRLLVIPFDKIGSGVIDQSMIKLTIGDNIPQIACGLLTFRPVVCRGMNILAFPNDAWLGSNSVRGIGPLLSRDGGKSFKWIVYDLPCVSDVYGIDFNDKKIILGNRGIYELDFNRLPADEKDSSRKKHRRL